MDMLSEWV